MRTSDGILVSLQVLSLLTGHSSMFDSEVGMLDTDTDVNIEWTPKTHWLFSEESRERVMIVLMMAALKQPDRTPCHPETLFHKLPRDLLHLILKLSISSHWS